MGKRKRLSDGDGHELDLEIVGLVQNAKYSEVKQDIPPPFLIPFRQDEELARRDRALRRAGLHGGA